MSRAGRGNRSKGVAGEREVRRELERHGFTVRGLEGAGDFLALRGGVTLHVEVKRQETLRLPLWSRQCAREAPAGTLPTVAFRRSREPWSAAVPEPELRPMHGYGFVRDLNGSAWRILQLADLARIVSPEWLPRVGPQ